MERLDQGHLNLKLEAIIIEKNHSNSLLIAIQNNIQARDQWRMLPTSWSLWRTYEHERDVDNHYDILECIKGMLMIIMTYLRAWKGCRWSLWHTWEHERDAMIIMTYLRAWKGCRWSLRRTWEHERDADDHYDIPNSMKGMPMILTTYLRVWKGCQWSLWYTWEHERDAVIIMTYLRAWNGCHDHYYIPENMKGSHDYYGAPESMKGMPMIIMTPSLLSLGPPPSYRADTQRVLRYALYIRT